MPRRISVEIVGDSRSVERAFRRAGVAGQGFSARMTGTSRSIARNVGIIGAAAATAGVVTSKAFSSFEQSLDRVVGLAGGSRKAVEGMSDAILKLGPQVAKSPQELAETLYFVASAGIAASDQMKVVEVSAKAAAAGLGETQSVADAVTSAMNAYGSSVVSAQRATDVLVNTVKFGKGEAASFAPVIGTVAAIAAQLGVKFEEVGAALAAQTRLGISAETAAIQLQATFSSLLKTAPKAEKALKGVGLSSAGLREELKQKGLLATLETLKTAFGDNTSEMAKAFPNIRALRGLLVLVGKNAKSTREVFKGMADSTGALGTAFGAVSKDEAFRFQQTLAALRVTAIRLGGILEPVAKSLSRGATAALGVVNDFLDKLGGAHTIRAKLDVVWQGVEGAAKGATAAIGMAVSKIKWDEVWAEARGIADGLQKQLEKVDFAIVGKRIGDSFATAARAAFPAAQELADRVSKAVRTIDWEQLGRAMGPGLATAVVTAFATLTDPSFWIRNWDLALAVALTVFGDGIGRLAAKGGALLAAKIGLEFRGLGPLLGSLLKRGVNEAGLALVGAVSRISERAGEALFSAFARFGPLVARALGGLGRFVAAALSPLTGIVKRVFGRLGRFSRFLVKVVGIDIAINAVVGFAKRVGKAFSGLASFVREKIQGMFNWLKRKAIEAALAIVEPFTHLPGFLGGGTFRRLKEEWQGTLKTMEVDASSSSKRIGSALDSIARHIQVSLEIVPTTGANVAGGKVRGEARAASAKAQAAAVAAAASSAAADQEEAAAEAADASAAAAKAAKAAARRAKKAKEAATKAFDSLMESLSLDLEKAEATRSLRDDIRVLEKTQAAIRERIKAIGKTTDLERQLFEAQRDLAEKRKEFRQARQFRALGLTDTGEDRVPGVKSLRKALGHIDVAIKGTFLDTKKTRGLLARIRRVLSGGLGAVGRDVREKIASILKDLNQQLTGGTGESGPKTKFHKIATRKLVEGLGLAPEQVKELRSRLSKLSPVVTQDGTTSSKGRKGPRVRAPRIHQPLPEGAPRVGGNVARSGVTNTGSGTVVIIHGDVVLPSVKDADGFQRWIQSKGRRTSAQRRGTRAGVNRGGA